MIFCPELSSSVELLYQMKPFSRQQRKLNISKRNDEIVCKLMEEIYISRLELQRWCLEFDIPFSTIYNLDLGLWFSKFLWGSCNLNTKLHYAGEQKDYTLINI
jgi:hypothetical protein